MDICDIYLGPVVLAWTTLRAKHSPFFSPQSAGSPHLHLSSVVVVLSYAWLDSFPNLNDVALWDVPGTSGGLLGLCTSA